VVGRHGPRQPHTGATFAAVRRLIEQTTLNYQQIAARTGVSTGCISYWKRDGGWKRPPFAPRANDTMPTVRASAHLRRRMLAARLDALAERHVRELEESARVDQARRGAGAFEMARLAARRHQAAAGRYGAGGGGARSYSSASAGWTSTARRARRSRIFSPTANRRPSLSGRPGAAPGASASMRG
jgi:hypothetical protein